MPCLQRHISEGVSAKLRRNLRLLKGLKTHSQLKEISESYRIMYTESTFGLRTKKVLICFLRMSKDGTSSKCLIKIFQEAIASGKKLCMYLFDLHIISRKVLRMLPLNKALQLGGSLSLR